MYILCFHFIGILVMNYVSLIMGVFRNPLYGMNWSILLSLPVGFLKVYDAVL